MLLCQNYVSHGFRENNGRAYGFKISLCISSAREAQASKHEVYASNRYYYVEL
ncbi:hypothetical protein APHCRT_0984 [Anaplasma phagocytophilum str. CRT53-1]|uniref:Uncharacterized protein n=1 Tax=Anaplasma phagocytophilum str. CRT53-1 TaxID=1359157 RepID=A0A0F3PZA1_ANAPH|nr:hypothetical protein APHCRT_0984 [Anaplasma phagocytophilum str. CRT53-1]